MDVKLPDGTIIHGVPDGTTRSDLAQKLKANGHQVPDEWLKPTYAENVKRTGDAFNKAAGTGLAGIARTGVAALEDAAAIGSGVAGDIGGAVTSLVTQNPKRGEDVRQALTYEPKTAAGQAGQAYIGALTAPATQLFGKPVEALQKSGHPILAQVARAGEDVAPLPVPKVLHEAGEAVRPVAERVARAGEETAAVRAAEEAPKQAKIEQARKLGLKIPPSEGGGGTVGKALEGFAGKIRTEADFSRDNAKVINREAGKDIGLSDRQPLTEGNIERLKQKQFSVYDRVRKAGRIESDDAFSQELEAAKERTKQEAEDYPEDTNELIDKELKKFNRPSADASSMLEKIKSLRDRASRNMKSPEAEKFELGIAQKKIATAMENLIERQVGAKDPGLIKDFRQARTNLAKIYNVEDALGPNGNLSAASLARMLKRGVPLSGSLRTIAETYQEFPKQLKYVDSLGGHTALSRLDFLVGGVEAAANPAKAGAIVGTLAGRPLASRILRSRAYQATLKPGEVRPSLTSRVARHVAGHTLDELPRGKKKTLTLGDVGTGAAISSDERQ